MYLPDTNIFIRAFKGKLEEKSFLEKAIEKNSLHISVIVIAEFLSGQGEIEEARKKFLILLSTFQIISIDKKVASIAAEYRRESIKTKKVYLLDCFLAAQAKIHNFTLVTNNKADFPMKDIRIITP